MTIVDRLPLAAPVAGSKRQPGDNDHQRTKRQKRHIKAVAKPIKVLLAKSRTLPCSLTSLSAHLALLVTVHSSVFGDAQKGQGNI